MMDVTFSLKLTNYLDLTKKEQSIMGVILTSHAYLTGKDLPTSFSLFGHGTPLSIFMNGQQPK